MKITAADITGVVGILPTPATANAARADAAHSVNVPETAKMVEAVIAAGTDIIMTTGTFGECSTLTWDELQTMVGCVVDVAAKRRPVFAGVTTLNTRDTIERARRLVDLGADGLFIGQPMWIALDQEMIVQYYRDIADALPNVPIVVYDNPHAFKVKVASETFAELSKIREIVAAKHVGGPSLKQDLESVGNRLRILPIEAAWYPMALALPEQAKACWSGFVACGPSAVQALSRAISERDWTQAKHVHERIGWACETLFPSGDLATFMDYSIQLGHERFRAAGIIDPGPSRPPYTKAPTQYIAGAQECGRRWSVIEAEFSQHVVVSA
jgi:4-(2-carboxyphenyl)-2-oxobut-3-enoate aldolase